MEGLFVLIALWFPPYDLTGFDFEHPKSEVILKNENGRAAHVSFDECVKAIDGTDENGKPNRRPGAFMVCLNEGHVVFKMNDGLFLLPQDGDK